MKKLEVKLKTTLKGDGTTYIDGSIFQGTVDDFPKAIADAIKHKERFIEVREVEVVEVPSEETSGTNPPDAADDAEPAADDTTGANEGDTPPENKEAAQDDSEPPKEDPPKPPVKSARKPRKTVKKTTTAKKPRGRRKLQPKE